MTAKEQMLSGEYYIPWDETLTQERERAKDLVFELNNIPPSQREKRKVVAQQLMPNLGENHWIESPFSCDYGYNIKTGKNFYTNTNCTILDCGEVIIGDDVLIGPNVSLYTVDHAFDGKERKAGYEIAYPIVIGDRVWLGGSVTIVGGVTIGENTIIAAGSVVTKDIPANVIAGGVPCRVIRPITEADRKGLDAD